MIQSVKEKKKKIEELYGALTMQMHSFVKSTSEIHLTFSGDF